MRTEIINIGDELLIGQVVNTNAAWMAEQMNLAGFQVIRTTVIADDHNEILRSLKESSERSDIVLITGGLGPTKDDITKTALCDFFGSPLVFSDEAFKDIERLFSLRGWMVSDLNRQQAMIPECCFPLPNRNGTAPGMWFEGRQTEDGGRQTGVMISMPGVPFEMKSMMTDFIIPRLLRQFKPMTIIHKTILTQGVGESFLADILETWETQLPKGVRLAYLPQPGIVRLRLSGSGENALEVSNAINTEVEKLEALIPQYIFGYNDDTLEELVGRLLMEKNATLATAESCTGGYIAHLLTSVPGSSGYFKGSIVAYSNELKEKLLGVSPKSIEKSGAVSEQVVTEMAVGAKARLNVDYVIAVSGIAGPDGGTPEKPVGTVWFAIAAPGEVFAKHFRFGEHRGRNIRRAALEGLNLLRKTLGTSETVAGL